MALPYPNVVVCELVVVLPLGLRPEPEVFANVGLVCWQSFLSKQHRLAQFVQQFVEVAGQTADNCPPSTRLGPPGFDIQKLRIKHIEAD